MVDAQATFLEVWFPGGRDLVVLSGARVTIGRTPGNDVVLAHDPQVSSLHAVVEAYGAAGWCVRDLGSTNGTVVDGERLHAERALRHGDELRIGQTRLTFRSPAADRDRTTAPKRAPELTRRERDVLVALCRPLFSGAMFPEPASARDVAAALVVTEAAVKQHLSRLYEKFELDSGTRRRRADLANEALLRGAVSPADLRLDRDGS
ncbi:FHA domain-containing protein [Actinomycetospora sp. CA-101289]|uniref:FHA domain-containing protein n=1 Tax=Actinomycetospora sp. CA-101289 TaxID=3239893 RepID=UPI003D95E592